MINLQALKKVLVDAECGTPEELVTVAQSVQAFALIAIAERIDQVVNLVKTAYGYPSE